jgi:hypothetical protein
MKDKYTEEITILTKDGELHLGAAYSEKTVIVRTYDNGFIEIIPFELDEKAARFEALDELVEQAQELGMGYEE